MYLRKYLRTDFEILSNWVTSAELLFQFAGTAWTFPLNEEQILQYESTFPERQFYIACDEQDIPFAFGEIIDGDINSPRLGRLLIGKSESRGKGLGLSFVLMLIGECLQKIDTEVIYLYVFQDNFRAIRCYEKAGFNFVPGKSVTFNHNGADETALLMQYTVTKN